MVQKEPFGERSTHACKALARGILEVKGTALNAASAPAAQARLQLQGAGWKSDHRPRLRASVETLPCTMRWQALRGVAPLSEDHAYIHAAGEAPPIAIPGVTLLALDPYR